MAERVAGGRLLEALGLTRRAGHLAVGTRAVLEAGDQGDLRLTVVAGDAGENALGRLSRVLDGSIPSVRAADRRALGEALGRGPVVALGVTEPGLARKVRRLAERAGGEPGRTRADDGSYDVGDGRTPGDAETNPIHAS